MPTNAASGSWCTINLIDRPTAGTATPCKEYKHETSTDPTTGAIQETATIESQAASPFEISFNIKPTTSSSLRKPAPASSKTRSATNNSPQSLVPEDYLVRFYLDGIDIGDCVLPRTHGFPYTVGGVSVGEGLYQPLQFAAVNLVDPDEHQPSDDDDKICEDEDVIKSLGTIRVNITRCVAVPQSTASFADQPDEIRTTNQMNFSERSKKACLATTAGLAKPTIDHKPAPAIIWEAENAEPKPFLEFIFKYKPQSILESEGIIAPTVPEAAAKAEPENKPKREENKTSKRIKSEDKKQKKSGQHEDKKPNVVDLTGSDSEEHHDKKSKIIDLTGSDESD